MEWWAVLAIMFASLVVAFASGIPVAFAFLALNIVGLVLVAGLKSLTLLPGSIFSSTTAFSLVAIPMFYLLGEVLFQSGIISKLMDTTDKWIGAIRGRLLYVSLAAGTGLATLSGAAMADAALLAGTVYPEMEKRGYDKKMSIGTITSSGLLAALIPPSALAVLLASLAEISTGRLLLAGFFPGLMLATMFGIYIFLRTMTDRSLAPSYSGVRISFTNKLWSTVQLMPLGLIIFFVMGFILLGIATPSEAAASGALGAILVTALYRRLNFTVLRRALEGVVRITGMVLIIVAGATAFGQLLAFTGATRGLFEFITSFDVSPLMILFIIQAGALLLGLFMDPVAIMLIAIPVVTPLVAEFGWDPAWFYVLFLMNMIIGIVSPPFGLVLFVVKGVLPQVSIGDIFKAQVPFILIYIVGILLVGIFPQIALWLPDQIQR
jgi:tripartite ATP-independent transporter DctM subunit